MLHDLTTLKILLKRLSLDQKKTVKRLLEGASRRQNIHLITPDEDELPEPILKKRHSPTFKISAFASTAAVALFMLMPTIGDVDDDHRHEPAFSELQGLIQGPQWSPTERRTWRRSGPCHRDYIKAPWKT